MSRSRKNILASGLKCAFLLNLLIFMHVLALAQTTAAIQGKVTDESGAIIPGVTIAATHIETGTNRTVVTDDGGFYHLPNLRVGVYEVRAELAGFSTQSRKGLELTIGQEVVLDFRMKVGEISEVVSVTSESPLINTTQATLAGVVDEQKIRDLPLNARDLLSLAPLSTAASFSDTAGKNTGRGYGTKITIAGTRYIGNAFLLDGTDIGDVANSAGSAAGILMGVETIREFNVITNAFTAEYGKHSGGVFNAITKSGTNSFHGSIFEFHRNDNLDARNFFDRDPANPTQRSDPPEFKRNQFGATAGGPIIKDRTFFFGSYEGLREGLGLTRQWNVPTAAARQGILPGRPPITPHPEVKKWLDAYPLPNGRDLGAGRAEFIKSVTQTTDQDFITARIDHRFSDTNSLFGRYSWDDAAKNDPQISHLFQDLTTAQYLTLEDTHTFSSSLLNRFMAAYTRSFLRTAIPLLPGVNLPALTFNGRRPLGAIATFGTGDTTTIGGNAIHPQSAIKNSFQFKDDVSYNMGSHALKFGAEIRRNQIRIGSVDRGAGGYTFRNLEEALRGEVDGFNSLLPESETLFHIRQTYAGFYVQDNIRMRSNLTMNLGIRYEFVTTPTEKFGHVSNARDYLTPGLTPDKFVTGDPYYDNPSYRSFGPRVGIAWDPWGDGKTSVRVGGGVYYDFYDPGPQSLGFYGNVPFFVKGEVSRTRVRVPIRFPDAYFTQLDLITNSLSAEGIQFDMDQAIVYKWALEIQRELTPSLRLDLGYNATSGANLLRVVNVNSTYPVTINQGRFWIAPGLGTLHPLMGRVRPRFSDAESSYHAFTLGVNRRFGDGFQFQASYTFSKVISDSDSFAGGNDFPGNDAGNKVSVPPFTFHKLDRGIANFNVTNNLFINGTWQIPVGPNRRVSLPGIANHVLGGWNISTILRFNDGPPFTPTVGSGVIPRGRGNGLDLVPGADPNPIRPQNANQYFDPASFMIPPDVGFIGNLGRNTVEGPGVAQVDVVLGKQFALTSLGEQARLEFRSEFFNLFNRANFGLPSTAIFNANRTIRGDAGQITSTRTTSRQIQFGLRLAW
ncbi:MAG: TonB-dependent receptor [Acidobacteria bacterium]|nr:TonB-dependent receptor [Acidobacteriota bacterium]